MNNLQNQLDQIDKLIKIGKFKDSKKLFQLVLNPQKIERRNAVLIASYARRLHIPKVSLRILRPYVRPRIHRFMIANEGEKAEYAAGLIQLGQINEALNLLKEIEYPKNYLKCFQIEASAHMSTWNYEYAEAALRKLLIVGEGKISSFDFMIADVNLAECLIYQRRFLEANNKLNKLISKIDPDQNKLTLSKCYELKAECELHEGGIF